MLNQYFSINPKSGVWNLNNQRNKYFIFQSYPTILLLLLFSFMAFSLSMADETTEMKPDVTVIDAVASPAKKGEKTRIRFKVENLLNREIVLQSVHAEIANATNMRMKVSNDEFETIVGIPILPEETLNLISSHIRIEMVDLLKDLESGTKFEFVLDFGDFKIAAFADAH